MRVRCCCASEIVSCCSIAPVDGDACNGHSARNGEGYGDCLSSIGRVGGWRVDGDCGDADGVDCYGSCALACGAAVVCGGYCDGEGAGGIVGVSIASRSSRKIVNWAAVAPVDRD